MLFKKLWRTMGQYKAQFISMVLMIALGIGIFLGFNMEWVSIETNTGTFFKDTGFSDYRLMSEAGFSAEELEKIEAIPGVEKAGRYLELTADVHEREGDSLALTVIDDPEVSGMLIMSGESYDPGSADGVWLSDKYAARNEFSAGDKITLTFQNVEAEFTVRGLIKSSTHMICVRNESQLMPDHDSYGFAYISPVAFKNAVGFEYYPQIHIISDLSKSEMTKKSDEVLKKTVMLMTKNEIVSYAEAMGESEEGKTMGAILPVLFLLIAVLTMVTTMHRLTAKEKTQIGTLKALGFKDGRIMRHYTSYALMIGLLGTAPGIALGYFVAWMIMNPKGMMGTYLDMPDWKIRMPLFCVIVMVLMIVLLTVIGWLSVRKMLHGSAAEALMPYTPKRMKKLLLEKTPLWKRLGFGTQWNLRDVMRHKSRSLMSLLGVFGCTVIIVATLGMNDTMNGFLDLYYDKAIKYTTRINIARGTDETADLIEKYSADSSASVAVLLGDKAVSLDIYDIPGELVRFPDEKSELIELSSDGAYICMRLSREFSLSPGDRFTVSPYGTDEKYELTVAGVIRSVSENIVITPAYAESLGLNYEINFLYTAAEREEISDSAAITNIQPKQDIIDSFDSFTEIMNTMIYLLLSAAVILGVVVLYNLGVMSYTERYREMATLKVVGFKDKKIGSLLIGQNLWISALGLVLGIPSGVWVLKFLLDALAGEYEMQLAVYPLSFLISVVLIVGMSLLVSLMVARKNRKIDMVEALKGLE